MQPCFGGYRQIFIMVMMEVKLRPLEMHPTTLQGYQVKNIRVMKGLCSVVKCMEGEGH